MTPTLLSITAVPLFIICWLSVRHQNNEHKKNTILSIYAIACLPLIIVLWMGFGILKQTIPPYLEIIRYEINQDSIFMGKHSDKCQVIVTDPAADDVHVLCNRNENQWIVQNLSSYRRVQVGKHYTQIHSAVLKPGDTFSVNNHRFKLHNIKVSKPLGWYQLTFYPHQTNQFEKKPLVVSTVFNQAIQIGPTQSKRWLTSPIIPIPEINQCVAKIVFKNNLPYLTYAYTSGKRQYHIYHNNDLLTRKTISMNLAEGETICFGRICYGAGLLSSDKASPVIIQPLTYRPRIYINDMPESWLVKKGERPYAQSVIDIPFALDQPVHFSLNNQILTVGDQSYAGGEMIRLTNQSGNALVLRYVDPTNMSVISFTESPVPGSLWIIIAILCMMVMLMLNIWTGQIQIKSLFIYYFLLCMCVLGALIACRMASFVPKHGRWPIEFAKYLFIANVIFLTLTNLQWLRWPYLRLTHSVYQVNRLIHHSLDFNGFFSKKLFHLFHIPVYPSTCIGTMVVFLFLLQLFVGSELGIVLPFVGLFQPVFLCEILIVLVIAFWTQRNLEAGQQGMGDALATKGNIYILMNRDILIFATCFIVLPLYVLRDFSPFLIFSTIILVSFCIRPTIPIQLRSVVLLMAFVTTILMILFPHYLGRTLASRINVWINPWLKTEQGFQFIQNLWMLKGVGFWGNGFGGTEVAIHFPALHRDFMVSLFIGDFGTFGLLMLIAIWSAFLLTIFIHSQVAYYHQNDNIQFIKMILFWLSFLFLLHTWFIIGSNLGLFPVMGIPLPFLARGFSCLIFLGFVGVGLCALCVNSLVAKQE
jgi:cell division protein FtsW (lipid II flippase)